MFRIVGAAVGALLLGGLGWAGTSCVYHLYQDHLLIDLIRQVNQQQHALQPTAPTVQPAPSGDR